MDASEIPRGRSETPLANPERFTPSEQAAFSAALERACGAAWQNAWTEAWLEKHGDEA